MKKQRPSRVQNMTFREKVDSHRRALVSWANKLDRQCYVFDRHGRLNEARCWKARGSQKMLWNVAGHLKEIRRRHRADYALYRALIEYLACLETSIADTNEEVRCLSRRRRPKSECWKVEGEAHILPRICAKLSRLVQKHAPMDDNSGLVLSLDGKDIVCFPHDEDQPVKVDDQNLPSLLERRGDEELLIPRTPRRVLQSNSVYPLKVSAKKALEAEMLLVEK